MKLDKELASKCRMIRLNAGISLREFANRTGLRIEDVKEFEKNMRPMPTKVLVEYKKIKEGLNEI